MHERQTEVQQSVAAQPVAAGGNARNDTPFFIVGSGRSGTTLLRLILASHSRIHVPAEMHFIEELVRELPLTEPLSSLEVARAIEIITGNRDWPAMEMTADEFRDRATALAKPKLADLISVIYAHNLRRHGKQRCGDKTPDHVTIVPQLSAVYPGAKFIHLIRDGRDVAISYIDVGWGRYYERKSFEWRLAMRARREYLASPYAAQILEVTYENLVIEAENTVRRICAFLEEAFEPAMLDWGGAIDLIPERDLSTIHTKLLRPLSNDTVGLWRNKLSAVECFAIESCLHKELRELGYQLRFRAAGWRPLLALSRWSLYLLEPLLKRVIPYLQRRNYLPQKIYL